MLYYICIFIYAPSPIPILPRALSAGGPLRLVATGDPHTSTSLKPHCSSGGWRGVRHPPSEGPKLVTAQVAAGPSAEQL